MARTQGGLDTRAILASCRCVAACQLFCPSPGGRCTWSNNGTGGYFPSGHGLELWRRGKGRGLDRVPLVFDLLFVYSVVLSSIFHFLSLRLFVPLIVFPFDLSQFVSKHTPYPLLVVVVTG